MKLKLIPFLLLLVFSAFGQIEKVLELEEIEYLNYDIQFKFGERLFFGTRNPSSLWITDGTASGTNKVEGISAIDNYYLVADDCFITISNELYKINPANYELEFVANTPGAIEKILPFNNEIVVYSREPYPNTFSYIQKINPDNGEQELVFQIADFIDGVVNFNDKLLLNYDTTLLISDGTTGGTMNLLENNPAGVQDIYLVQNSIIDDQYIFTLRTEMYGSEPWITDGTVDGTALLKDIYTGNPNNIHANSSNSSNFFNLNNEKYFVAYNEGFDLSLFKTNGSSDGTEAVFSFRDEFNILVIYELYTFNDEVYMEATSESTGYELWKTDGTLAGTKVVKDIWKGSGGYASNGRRRYRSFTEDYMYFNANDGVSGFEIWRTDGTEIGTAMISDFSPGADWTNSIPLATLDNSFYFIEGKREDGFRLYRFDEATPLQEIPPYAKSYDWFETIGYYYRSSNNTPFLFNDQMKIDGTGNVYVMGEFSDFHLQFYSSTDFIQMSTINEGNRRGFVASYDDKGQFRWAKEIGGSSFGKEQSLAIDPENNVICGGVYGDKGVLGSVPMNDANNRFFLAKFSTDGDLVWKKQGNIGQGYKSEINYIETDPEGNIYVGGCFTDFFAQFGPHQIDAEISPSFFVAKYDKDGNELWLKHLPFPSVELHGFVKSLQVYDDNLYVVISDGDYNWSSSCDFRSFDMQLYVLDKKGEVVNEKRFTSDDFSFVTNAKFSPSGFLHLIGMFRGDFEIGNITLTADCEDSRGFLIKLDPELNLIDAFSLETSETYPQEIEFGANATYYLSGRQVLDSVPKYSFNYFGNIRNKTFVKKYDKHNSLIDERYFGKLHSGNSDSRPLFVLDSEEKIILSDRYRGLLDTFPVNGSFGMNVGLIKFSLEEEANYPKDEMVDDSEVLLFPNPASAEITIFSKDEDFQDATFHIYDAIGQWIESPSVSNDYGIVKVDINNLAAGVYFLQVRVGEEEFTKRFIKGR